MRLGELIGGTGAARGGGGGAGEDVEIAALAYDSRTVTPGSLFFCVPGFEADGHEFAARAVERGAVAVVCERELGLGVAEIAVASVRAAVGPLAARFYGDPSAGLRVVGVTGTNGKTTTAFLVRALLEATGEQTGLLGTVKSVIGGREREVQHTTAEAIDLQADLRAMLDGGDRACAMEVSSHALELGRVAGVRFAAAIFTNLTQDHLDFHPTMEHYFAAKRLLFAPAGEGPAPAVSVINVDDPYGRRLAGEIEGALTFSLEETDADYRASRLRCGARECAFELHTPVAAGEARLGLPGRFNVANALGALAAAHALGGDLDVLVSALERGVRVPGRFEPVDAGQDFAVLVDYAHTPDSLQNVLEAARDIAAGRLICVFGAGGDRDRGKRPLMGEIAGRLADLTIVTSDNPRSEEPAAIVAEIVAGVAGGDGGSVEVEVDRRAAIAAAIELARPGDVVLIAGKGHEQGQELAGGHRIAFDDAAVAREELARRGGSPAAGERPTTPARAGGGSRG
ncbi:MAG TPA: UDP-N-acetylmuramoyl-L-alanyl-D-glutamate--2,6-diaminopimelate ligase [Solirubrobacteraceae bacterium]|nr:UDP-N-acetylmuramoyl-L-alanyl-D-glutamate--2,6-diaminopimelate ligase [Solirubrobacteraceae bacterium]